MISGTISQNPTSCATPQDLEGLPDDALLNGEFAYVASLDKTYQLKRTSTSSPSGTTILSTFSGNGRWIEWTSGGGIGLSFPNYVDLRAYNIANTPDGTGVFVAGSASVGSGGEGVYYYDTGSLDVDDEGIVLKPDQIDGGDPGRWIRSYTGPIDARWFGATGDGNTDDYAAIAATFAACPDNGEVLLPEGTGYLISQQLRVDRPVSVRNRVRWWCCRRTARGRLLERSRGSRTFRSVERGWNRGFHRDCRERVCDAHSG